MARVLKMTSATPARPQGRSPKTTGAPAVGEVSVAEIAAEAYALFEARAGGPGDSVSDWLEAERIVRARQQPATPKRTRARRPKSSTS